MAKKWRSAESYYGNTAEARKRQRANLIPGNSWQKRRTQIFRLECFWEFADLEAKQMFYETFETGRNIEGIDKKELKNEKYIDNWWENELNFEEKQNIYKEVISWQNPRMKAKALNYIVKCLKKKSSILYRG